MDRYELVEFFGVLPVKIDEEDCYELYRISKDKDVLEIAFSFSSGFSLLLFNKDSVNPLFSINSNSPVKIERQTHKNGYDCLEIIVPQLNRHWEADWNHIYTVKIFIEPNIKVEIL